VLRDKTKASRRMKESKPHSEQPPPTPSVTPAAPAADVALIHGVSPNGAVHIIRKRGDRLEAGALTPLREGEPIQGEVVSLRPRPGCPVLCDVDVHYAPPQPSSAAPPSLGHKGPALVASDRYRDNWDSIWNRKKNEALN
jgi:hypothetical protein